MNNNGATTIIEKTDTVPVGVVEEVLNNSVNLGNLDRIRHDQGLTEREPRSGSNFRFVKKKIVF